MPKTIDLRMTKIKKSKAKAVNVVRRMFLEVIFSKEPEEELSFY